MFVLAYNLCIVAIFASMKRLSVCHDLKGDGLAFICGRVLLFPKMARKNQSVLNKSAFQLPNNIFKKHSFSPFSSFFPLQNQLLVRPCTAWHSKTKCTIARRETKRREAVVRCLQLRYRSYNKPCETAVHICGKIAALRRKTDIRKLRA